MRTRVCPYKITRSVKGSDLRSPSIVMFSLAHPPAFVWRLAYIHKRMACPQEHYRRLSETSFAQMLSWGATLTTISLRVAGNLIPRSAIEEWQLTLTLTPAHDEDSILNSPDAQAWFSRGTAWSGRKRRLMPCVVSGMRSWNKA